MQRIRGINLITSELPVCLAQNLQIPGSHGFIFFLMREQCAGNVRVKLFQRFAIQPTVLASNADRDKRIIVHMTETQKTVVVIEDDRDISATIQSVLTAAGYRVLTASNGQDGRRLIQTQKPDLVLTDMMMPRMGGFPVLEFLADLPNAPPVIMMTANEGSRHKAYAEMLGVVDYLRKPFAMEVMLESIARALAAAPNDPAT